MTTRRVVAVLAGLMAGSGGCRGPGPESVLARTTDVIDQTIINRIVSRAPLSPGEPMHVAAILRGDALSGFVYQIAARQPRHLHQDHDLTIVVNRGRGNLFIEDRRRHMKPGDFFHIPRGLPHYCVNTGAEPLVVVVLFSPALDADDTIEVPRGARSYDRR